MVMCIEVVFKERVCLSLLIYGLIFQPATGMLTTLLHYSQEGQQSAVGAKSL
jgi:hypothetical protein